MSILKIENACLAYGDTVVFDHFNLLVDGGETVCISGESGCGKTSILNAILGFVPLRSGRITVDGVELSSATVDKTRQRIAWLPQELALPSEWVKEMVQLPFMLRGNRDIKFSKKRLFECFDVLGLEHDLYAKRVSEISGGQRQRIMIAVASLLGKPLLIADEPTSALDTTSSARVIEFFRQSAFGGKAVLIVSHDKQVADAADKHIIL